MNDILLGLLIAVIVYVGFLVIWGVICLLAYSLSLVTRKSFFISAVLGFNVVVMWIFNLLVGFSLLAYTVSLLLNGQFLWFIAMIFVGFGLISGVLSWLQMPFLLITSYFSEKVEKMQSEPDTLKAEILDENHKVVGVIEGEKEINQRLAKFFLIAYALNLANLLTSMKEYPDYKYGDYLVMPAVWVLTSTLVVGLFLGLFYLVTKRRFFYPRKKIFLAKTLKVVSILLAIIWMLSVAVVWLYS